MLNLIDEIWFAKFTLLGFQVPICQISMPTLRFSFWLAKSTCTLLSSWLFEAWDESFQNSRYDLYTNVLNILRANWKAWMLWNWSHPNGMEAYSWKFIRSFDEIKFIQEIPSITLCHPWSVVHSPVFFTFMWIEWYSAWCTVRQDVPLNFTGLLFCPLHSSCSGTQFRFWCSA